MGCPHLFRNTRWSAGDSLSMTKVQQQFEATKDNAGAYCLCHAPERENGHAKNGLRRDLRSSPAQPRQLARPCCKEKSTAHDPGVLARHIDQVHLTMHPFPTSRDMRLSTEVLACVEWCGVARTTRCTRDYAPQQASQRVDRGQPLVACGDRPFAGFL